MAQRPLSTQSDQSVASSSSASAATGGPGPSTAARQQRQRPRLTGPRLRKPSAKATLPGSSESAQHDQQHAQSVPTPVPEQPEREEQLEQRDRVREQEHEHEQERARTPSRDEAEQQVQARDSVYKRQSEQLPSYVQSQYQHDPEPLPLRPFSPDPPSAGASDSSCSYNNVSGPVSNGANETSLPRIETSAAAPLAMPAPVRTSSPLPLPSLTPTPSTHELSLHAHASTHSLGTVHTTTTTTTKPSTPTPGPSPNIPSISQPTTPRPETPASIKSRSTTLSVSAPASAPMQPIQQPPPIDFSSVPIPYKALTLDAAQWTFSSTELQAIVSRAIRASAEPSSIKLLPLQVSDKELGEEVERLERERMEVQAKYRFTVHRRTMLLQSLNAVASQPGGGFSSTLGGTSSSTSTSTSPSALTFSQAGAGLSPPSPSPASELVHRLAEIGVSLDTFAQALLRISDQLSQIRALQDVHAASALAVALRKLNASYARRTREVAGLRERVEQVEEERDEAWRVAEDLALEADAEKEVGMEGEVEEDEEWEDVDVVNAERAVAASATLTRASKVGSAGIRIKVPGVGPRIRHPSPNKEKSSTPGSVLGGDVDVDVDIESPIIDDTPASSKSDRPPGRRKRTNSAASRVSAARTRSLRASKASLRLPRPRRSETDSAVGTGTGTRPPSAYSQASSVGTRPRSNSRAGSSVGSPADALEVGGRASLSGGHDDQTSVEIPDVPKLPDAKELERLESGKAKTAQGTLLSPMSAATTSTGVGEGIPSPSSFLEITPTPTRPGSATDEEVAPPVPEKDGALGGLGGNEDADGGVKKDALVDLSVNADADSELNGVAGPQLISGEMHALFRFHLPNQLL
jgi:hypothetical protein